MAFVFPADKVDFTASNGITYTYRDDAWQVKSFGVDNSDEIAEILAELQLEIDALPVTIADTPPTEPEDGDLWFDSGDTLQLFIQYGGEWVVASPPVSTEGIEAIASDAQATANTAVQKAQYVQFQLDQQSEIVRWDQERQDGLIATLEEEIEQIKPSIERGVWNYNGEDNWTAAGNFILIQEFLEEDAQEQLCNEAFGKCIEGKSPGTPEYSACNREFDTCKSVIDGGKWVLTNQWDKAESIGFAFEDALGTDHTFDLVEAGMTMDVFNVNNDGYMLAML